MKIKILLLSITWILLAVLLSPSVEMFYTDDWAYAKPVKTLLETGDVHITDWSSMTLVTHIYWGALFCKILGFSMLSLRISILVMGLMGLIATLLLFKEFVEDYFFIMLGTLLLFFNPTYFMHSYTFMTDITYYALIMWACLYFVKYLKNEKNTSLITANIICIFAVLTRDVALFVPFAFSISLLLKNGFSRKAIIACLVTITLALLTYFGYRWWLVNVHTLPASIDFSRNRMLKVFTQSFSWFLVVYLKNTFFSLVFLGIFFLPIVIISLLRLVKDLKEKNRRIFIYTIFTFSVIASVCLYLVPKLLPQTYQYTFSAVFLYYFWFPDIHYPSLNSVYILPGYITNTLLVTGIFSGLAILAMFLYKLFRIIIEWREKNILQRDYLSVFIYLNILFYFLPVLSQGFISRYLLFILPLVMLAIFRAGKSEIKLNRTSFAFILLFIAALSYYTIASTHDLLSFSTARAKAIEYLTKEKKIPETKIDGGFEWNAWYFYNYTYKPPGWRNWWYVIDDEYVVTWGEIPKFSLVGKVPYSRWLPPGRTDFYYIYKKH